MILGDRCTRTCAFCAVKHPPVELPDPNEPFRVAEAVQSMALKYAVITSVTRDDIPDGGASLFSRTITAIQEKNPHTLVEVLIPDLQGSEHALRTVLDAHPHVLNHNIETVPRLYAKVRPQANYTRSLTVLKRAQQIKPHITTKSGLMMGMGETRTEIRQTLKDLLSAGCRIVTLGQYLQPSKQHWPLERYVPPQEFDQWRKEALTMGFLEVASGPFVRSSYNAHTIYNATIKSGTR